MSDLRQSKAIIDMLAGEGHFIWAEPDRTPDMAGREPLAEHHSGRIPNGDRTSENPFRSIVRPKDNEVLVWQVPLGRDEDAFRELFAHLSREEKDRADRFRFARDRDRFVVARGTLREIVGDCLNVEPQQVRFRVNEYGKPFIDSDDEALRFNVSHSRDLALIAVTIGREIGVDIEFIDHQLDAVSTARSVFSKSEIDELESLTGTTRTNAFFRGWTRKEAYLKAIGMGFSAVSEDLPVSMFNESTGSMFEAQFGASTRMWSLISLAETAEFCSALAVEGTVESVSVTGRFEQRPTLLASVMMSRTQDRIVGRRIE
ncbi:MAG: 4'-phosphopantetheinyl transferase superfamily protein [Acidobacteriota bacterium]|nr:MAG: 4'-phosphopantetheinyl transferase superfamily protein [Acidobacteriota bacterium]